MASETLSRPRAGSGVLPSIKRDPLPESLGQVPAAICAAYRQCGLGNARVDQAVMRFWSEGGEPEANLWEMITEHARDWGVPLGYEIWLPGLSQLLRAVVNIDQRRQYHDRLIPLLAPLMPIPELLRLRDLREEPWREPRRDNWKQVEAWLDAMANPYACNPQERQDPAFPEPALLQNQRLQDEIQQFIESLPDYPGADDAMRAFSAFREVREAMDAYDLHRWFRWLSVFMLDRWVERGLFDPYRWWTAFFDPSPQPIKVIRGSINSAADSVFSHYPQRLAARLASDDETLAKFLGVAPEHVCKAIAKMRDNPLTETSEAWLQLARLTLPRGFMPLEGQQAPTGKTAYQSLRPLLDLIEDPELAVSVARRIVYPELAGHEYEGIVVRCLEVCGQAGNPLTEASWMGLVRHLRDADVILNLLEQEHADLRKLLVGRYAGCGDWSRLRDFAARHPDVIRRAAPSTMDVPLLRIVWRNGLEEERKWVIRALCSKLSSLRQCDENAEQLADFFAELCQGDAPMLLAHLNLYYIEGWSHFRPLGASLVWQRHLPEIDPLLLAMLDTRSSRDGQAVDLAREIMEARPDYLLNIKPAKVAEVLPCLSEPLLEQVAPVLLKVVEKSAAQGLRDSLANLFGRFDHDLLRKLGWLEKRTKNVRQANMEILIQHPQPGALEQLRAFCRDKKLDQASKDRILAHLEARGENLQDLDELAGLSLVELTRQAGKLKRVSKTVEQVYSDELARLTPCLDPALLRWLLQQVASDQSDGVPRSVGPVLQHCPRVERVRLIEALVKQWLAHDGDPKLRWLLRLVPYGADDRLVAPLTDAVSAWYKQRKPRAVHAVQALARIDTTFALSQVKAVAETRKYPHMLVDAANQELHEAARRRNQSLTDIYDELVPDFGLGDKGLALDVGPYHYRVKLQGDLGLQVINPQGKATKTLPKAKKDEDPEKRAEAEAILKRVRKDIKTIAAQQTARMGKALLGGRVWPVSRWRHLFVQHPLFRSLAQSLIWTRRSKGGQVLDTFRLAEDLSLIGYDDEPVVLADGDGIGLWHPVESAAAVAEGWRRHMQDYALTPLLDQANLPVVELEAEWCKDNRLVAYQGHVVKQGKLKALLAKWGYRTGSVGDGGYIYDHSLALNDAHLLVRLHHTAMPAWMELDHEIALDNITVYALNSAGRNRYGDGFRDGVGPGQLPKATVAVLLAQLQALAEQGCGFREGWEKL